MKANRNWRWLGMIVFLAASLHGPALRAAEAGGANGAAPAAGEEPPEDDIKIEEGEGKPLEGVTIEALESYSAMKTNEIGFQLGLFPFNSYYTGFSLNAYYDYHVNKWFTWEIANFSVIYSVATDLTSQLADTYNVNPELIEKLTYIVASDLEFTFLRGKSLLFGSYIRNLQMSAIAGAGLVTTSQKSEATSVTGLAVDGLIGDTFSVRSEFRELVTLSGKTFGYFTFGLGIHF